MSASDSSGSIRLFRSSLLSIDADTQHQANSDVNGGPCGDIMRCRADSHSNSCADGNSESYSAALATGFRFVVWWLVHGSRIPRRVGRSSPIYLLQEPPEERRCPA